MKIERSKEWWMARARHEGDVAIGAGLLAFDPSPDARPTREQCVAADDAHLAFGKFVNLARRSRGYSTEKLAQVADLDTSELLTIENDIHYIPEPRTVFKLARTFEVSHQLLIQLAGLAANDAGFRKEAVRFAARSEAVQKLSPEENSAFEAFVAILSQQESKQAK